ncbi:hypothetical protein [Streptomyces spiramenti]|uniref:DNA-directed RNA polymerase specialized sigma24 family protein n=1 Tax=Streptomyces spiramenti TaxID=2720606 RepID=A0ABX1APV7_9ACTN|nr:hypothetical protein [Streptomyces spiramenti]NJP67849.1 hypothetical protein [Streptomyces spiramenti]
MTPSQPSPTEPAPSTGAEPRPGSAVVRLDVAEAAIVEHYARLVRLGYLVLPPDLARHKRVVAAHALAQRALPRSRTTRLARPELLGHRSPAGPSAAEDPAGEDGTDRANADPGYACLRERLVASVLAVADRSAAPSRGPAGALRRIGRGPRFLPQVLGLRLSPLPAGAEALAMEQALLGAAPAVRVAFALARLERLGPREAESLLTAARVRPEEARAAVEAAAALPGGDRPPLEDPCALRARPGDLLRRRQYRRSGVAAAGALMLGAGLLAAFGTDGAPGGSPAPSDDAGSGEAAPRNPALVASADPEQLERVPEGAWRDASRVDFASWEPRGTAVDDEELLGRALAAWAAAGPEVTVTATPGTATGPPPAAPRLLYAGQVADRSLVLLHDGLRLARYAEPADGRSGDEQGGTGAADEDRGERADRSGGDRAPAAAGATLELARVDGASGGHPAVVLHREADGVRYLTAPWVESADVHDLLAPGAAPTEVALGQDGVTAPVPTAVGAAECTNSPLLELTTPSGLPTGVLVDMGELVPVAVTDAAPGVGHGHPLRGEAADRLARTACHLPELAGSGVRLVNSWEFASQELPDDGGRASWVCTRAETWRGEGVRTMTQLHLPPDGGSGAADDEDRTGERGGAARAFGEPGEVTARAEGGADCTLREHHFVASALWRSPDDRWYLIAAASPGVGDLVAHGDVDGSAAGRTLSVPAAEDADAEVVGVVTETGADATELR